METHIAFDAVVLQNTYNLTLADMMKWSVRDSIKDRQKNDMSMTHSFTIPFSFCSMLL